MSAYARRFASRFADGRAQDCIVLARSYRTSWLPRCGYAFHVPHVKRDGLLTTEQALGAVNRHTSHHRHHTILLLTLVHIEQNVNSTSHVSYSVFNSGCKTTISFGIHRYAKCSSLRNKNGLRFGNLTPSPILPNLLFDPN